MLVKAEKARAGAGGVEEVYFYHTNHLGTPIKLTDENGDVVWDMDCSPFMEVCLTNGRVNQPLRFPGQYYDEETELHYNWHRYSKPGWGRYMEYEPDVVFKQDGSKEVPYYISAEIFEFQKYKPLVERGETNFYLYALNNPLMEVDVRGLGDRKRCTYYDN